jgi:hypothetical protein
MKSKFLGVGQISRTFIALNLSTAAFLVCAVFAQAKTSAPVESSNVKERLAKIGSKPAMPRDRASIHGKNVFEIPAGSAVTRLGEEAGYLKLRYASPKGITQIGYVHKNALTVFESKAAALGTGQRVDLGPTEGAQGAGVRLGKTEAEPPGNEAASESSSGGQPGRAARSSPFNAAVPESIAPPPGASPADAFAADASAVAASPADADPRSRPAQSEAARAESAPGQISNQALQPVLQATPQAARGVATGVEPIVEPETLPEPPPPNLDAEVSSQPMTSLSPSPNPAASKKKIKSKPMKKNKSPRKSVRKSAPDARLMIEKQLTPEYGALWRKAYGDMPAAAVQDEELLSFMLEGGLQSRVLQ